MSDMDFPGLKDFLLQNIKKTLFDLLPGGKINGNEYECATIHGGKGTSCKTNIVTGVGADFATGQSWSDLISLYAEQQRIKQSEAYVKLSDMYQYNSSHLPKHPRYGKTIKTWDYRDSSGKIIFHIARYDTTDGKQFSPITKNESGVYKFKAPSRPYPLFQLDLLSQHTDRPVLVVEGEKCAVAAQSLVGDKYVVTCWPFGANGIKHIDLSPLHGRKVLLWPDADRKVYRDNDAIAPGFSVGEIKPYDLQPGPAAMLAIASRIVQRAQYVKIINVGIDELRPDGWDAADAVAEGWTWDRFFLWARDNVKIINPLQEVSASSTMRGNPLELPPAVPDEEPPEDDSGNTNGQPKQLGYEAERTLTFANKICGDHILAYNENTDTLYRYAEGYYQVIKHGTHASIVNKMVIDMERGETLTVANRQNVISNIETLSFVNPDKFENSIINFQNCLFDPLNGTKMPHSPACISTIRIPYDYDPEAKCDRWESFLVDILEDNYNKIRILQEFVGYCFIKSCKYEKALFIPGGGQNGKGTFTSTVLALFGGSKNVSAANLEQLADDVRRSAIVNKYLNIDTEVPKRAEKYESAFKQVVSGEDMLFNEKYVAPYSIAPFCKLIFSANKMPRIDEGTRGFFRRLIIIPFTKTISEKDKDVHLKNKLKQELPGIFNWAMIGLRRLLDNDRFTPDESAESAVESLRKDNNPILQFADDCLNFHGNPAFGVAKKNLYDTYRQWCKDNGHGQLSYRRFNADFLEEFAAHTEADRQNGKLPTKDRYWPGISRKNSAEYGEVIDELPNFEE